MSIDWLQIEEDFALSTATVGETIELDGLFGNYIYQNENFVIASFMHSSYESFVVLGTIPFELKNGREYHIRGSVEENLNKRTGLMDRQVRVESIAVMPPKGEVGIVRFLQSLDGIQLIAHRLYDVYKDEAIKILKTDPERVAQEIKGITLKKAMNIQEQLLNSEDSSQALTFLLNFGFNMKESERMVNTWGDKIVSMVQENPYILMKSNSGFPNVGFRKADKIALKLNLKMNSEERIEAGIDYALELQGNHGHVYTDLETLAREATRVLTIPSVKVDQADVEEKIEELILARTLIYEEGRVYPKGLYYAEIDLAENMLALTKETAWQNTVDREKLLDDYLTKEGYHLEKAQRQAVLEFTAYKGDVCVLNGAAGTGKTFTLQVILNILNKLYRYEDAPYYDILMAPTGKAAKVLRQATGKSATTIHSQLMPNAEGGFVYNAGNKVKANVIVVDETSMLDTYLAKSLLEAIKNGSKVIFLGDINQLPSVGAGNVLSDVIDSEKVKVVTLDVPKRQKAGSMIAENGTRIIKEEVIESNNQDSFILKVRSREQARKFAIQSVLRMMKPPYNYSLDEIQVISPMKKGFNGTLILNYELQHILNPGNTGLTTLNRRFTLDGFQYELMFKAGDRIIQLSNNSDLVWYNKVGNDYKPKPDQSQPVTNGEVGTIVSITQEEIEDSRKNKRMSQVILVKFDDGYVKYVGNDKQNIDHAFAISIHKSQGSQWKVVIQLLSNEHRMMLDNSLLYTGYTRAQERQVLIMEPAAYEEALHTRKGRQRKTTLIKRLG